MSPTITPNLPLNADPALKEWFRVYYVKWMEVAENQRWAVAGRGPKYPTALIPFIPFGQVPALPFHHVLTSLIDSQLCAIGDRLANPLGGKGHMATIVIDEPELPSPYIFFETVFGGVVTDFRMYRDTTWDVVAAKLAAENIDPNCYKKIVYTSFLRKLYKLHQQWLTDGDNARYLIGFLTTLLAAIDDGTAKVEPRPLMLQNVLTIKDSVQLGDVDVTGTLLKFAHLAPNLTIAGRGGDMPIDLGGKLTLVLTEPGLLALLDGLKFSKNLAELTAFLIGFAGRGMTEDWIALGGARWLSKVSAYFLRHRIRALPKKVQILTKIMGNPFRLLLCVKDKGVLVTFNNGLPESVKPAPVPPDAASLKDVWLECCAKQGFINLAVRPKEGKFNLQVFEQIDYYPQNDFVKYMMRKGALQFLFGLVFPFLSS